MEIMGDQIIIYFISYDYLFLLSFSLFWFTFLTCYYPLIIIFIIYLTFNLLIILDLSLTHHSLINFHILGHFTFSLNTKLVLPCVVMWILSFLITCSQSRDITWSVTLFPWLTTWNWVWQRLIVSSEVWLMPHSRYAIVLRYSEPQ